MEQPAGTFKRRNARGRAFVDTLENQGLEGFKAEPPWTEALGTPWGALGTLEALGDALGGFGDAMKSIGDALGDQLGPTWSQIAPTCH